jgi:hypothetical protein
MGVFVEYTYIQKGTGKRKRERKSVSTKKIVDVIINITFIRKKKID